jgi:hypothetical protein
MVDARLRGLAATSRSVLANQRATRVAVNPRYFLIFALSLVSLLTLTSPVSYMAISGHKLTS